MSKDLLLAVGVLVICLVILIAASSEPATTADNQSSRALASVDIEIPVAGDEGLMPGLEDSDMIDLGSNFGGVDSDTVETRRDDSEFIDIDKHLSDDEPELTVVVEEDPFVASVHETTDPVESTDSVNFDIVSGNHDDMRSAAPAAGLDGDQIHTVIAGDILGSISQKWYGTTRHWKKIRDTNNIYENELQVGQRLIIPAIQNPEETVARATNSTGDLKAGQRLYTVQRGDSYYMIAQRELGDSGRYKEIQELNEISAYELMPYTQIILPAASQSRGVRTESTPRIIAGAQIHTIEAAETLSDISVQYYGTAHRWREIAAANGNLDPARLSIGAKLQIPQVGAARATGSATSGTVTPRIRATDGSQEYTILRGDRLAEISKKFYGTHQQWKRIQRANPGLNPNKLIPGKKIIIPAAVGAPTATPQPDVEHIGGGTRVDFRGL